MENDIKLRKAISDISLHIEDIEDHVTSKIECECCGLNEECSFNYIEQVKDIHNGRWVCGLCSEAVKERLIHHHHHSSTIITSTSKMVMMIDALSLHKEFCDEFNNTTRINPQLSLTCSLKGIAIRSSQRRILSRDDKKLPLSRLARSSSCLPRIEIDRHGGKP
ncbi:uncharacterized protein [Spinacia oleracea]|uniref:DUF1677 domain-containing protein n=1 Tax=Spinacia oleracea TaxID=3562 RepID=A0ABM3R5G3_SPIOL|nr:uncharacterized protein LOC130466180 [Spinacia oleracea]